MYALFILQEMRYSIAEAKAFSGIILETFPPIWTSRLHTLPMSRCWHTVYLVWPENGKVWRSGGCGIYQSRCEGVICNLHTLLERFQERIACGLQKGSHINFILPE